MSGPVIPYLSKNEWPLDFLSFLTSKEDPPTIKTFGILVALGVYIGSVVAVRHSKQRGLDQDKMNSFIFWVVGIGFIGGHVFDAIFYTPDRIAKDPLYLLKIWAGLSSFGGFLGAIIGAVLFKVIKKERILPFVDTVCSAFPLAWVFGRSGCASVHDHPGRCSDAWFAVKYPQNVPGLEPCGEGIGRLDLGFIEMVLSIPLAIAFWYLWRKKPRQYGFFAGWMCVAYAPVRFLLDFLRIQPTGGHEADPRYGGLTPAQWACFALVGLGIAIVRMGRNFPPVPATYAEMQENARREILEREGEGDDDAIEGDDEAPRKPAPRVVKGSVAKPVGKPTTKTTTKPKPAVVEEEDEADERPAPDDDEPKEEPAATEPDADEPAPVERAPEPITPAARPKKKKKKAGSKPKKDDSPADD